MFQVPNKHYQLNGWVAPLAIAEYGLPTCRVVDNQRKVLINALVARAETLCEGSSGITACEPWLAGQKAVQGWCAGTGKKQRQKRSHIEHDQLSVIASWPFAEEGEVMHQGPGDEDVSEAVQ